MTKSARRLSAALLAAPFIVALSGTAALAAPASASPTGTAAPAAKTVTPNGGAVTECLMWGVCPPSAE